MPDTITTGEITVDKTLRDQARICYECGGWEFLLLRSGEVECCTCGLIAEKIYCYDVDDILVH